MSRVEMGRIDQQDHDDYQQTAEAPQGIPQHYGGVAVQPGIFRKILPALLEMFLDSDQLVSGLQRLLLFYA